MSGTDIGSDPSFQSPEVGTMDTRLEVDVVPVSDVDRPPGR
jgi:hypothetical protein